MAWSWRAVQVWAELGPDRDAAAWAARAGVGVRTAERWAASALLGVWSADPVEILAQSGWVRLGRAAAATGVDLDGSELVAGLTGRAPRR